MSDESIHFQPYIVPLTHFPRQWDTEYEGKSLI